VVLSSRRTIRSGLIGTIRPAPGPPILHHDASWTCRILPGRQASPTGCHASLVAMPPRQVVAAGWASPNRRTRPPLALQRHSRFARPPTLGSSSAELGPRWVRAATVQYGQQRAPTVTNGSEEPHVAGLRAHAAGMMQAGDSDCGPDGREGSRHPRFRERAPMSFPRPIGLY
jgi:hypothetical protein